MFVLDAGKKWTTSSCIFKEHFTNLVAEDWNALRSSGSEEEDLEDVKDDPECRECLKAARFKLGDKVKTHDLLGNEVIATVQEYRPVEDDHGEWQLYYKVKYTIDYGMHKGTVVEPP